LGQGLAKNYPDAIRSFKEVVELHRKLARKSQGVAITLAPLAVAERLSGDVDAAAVYYREALRIDQLSEIRRESL